MKASGFDWDAGNWPKCGKHGVSKAEIEHIFHDTPMVQTDPHGLEPRYRAIGKNELGRYIFLVFMFRVINGQKMIRPISARYMHNKEVSHYESQ